MRRSSRGVATAVLAVALMAAPVAQAGPLDGWAGWWADAWQSVLAVFGASSTETTPEPEPEPVPPPKDEPPNTTNSCPTCGGGDTDGGPHIDPNG